MAACMGRSPKDCVGVASVALKRAGHGGSTVSFGLPLHNAEARDRGSITAGNGKGEMQEHAAGWPLPFCCAVEEGAVEEATRLRARDGRSLLPVCGRRAELRGRQSGRAMWVAR